MGGFSPLDGFMDEETYKSVVGGMKLPSGLMFSLPVVFDTDDEKLGPGSKILLKQGDLDVATFEVSDKYEPDKPLECLKCYGTSSLEHPGTQMVAMERGKYYLGGKLTGLNKPVREFPCETPEEVRARLPDDVDIVAFQCRNPVHRAHYELFTRALDAPNVGKDGVVLVHPTCGPTQPGVPALLDAHGRPARGHPPHDDPQELRLHALHYWARHGGLQVVHRRGGLLRGLRRAGLRARERPEDGHAGRAVPQFGVHRRGGLRHGRGGQGEGAVGPQTVGHEVPQDAPRRRGHPGVVRLQVRRRGAPPERLGVFYPSCIISSK